MYISLDEIGDDATGRYLAHVVIEALDTVQDLECFYSM